MANFSKRGRSHVFITKIGDISENFSTSFGYYMQKDFGADFKRTTKKFGLKF